MRETHFPTSPDGDHLEFQALLYATGELEGAELTRFEKRLGEDQEAREALCHTMGITLALSGHLPTVPHPSYRDVVRQRLFPPQPVWQGWVQPVIKWSHPAVWTAAGTLLVLLALGLARPPHSKVSDVEQKHPSSEPISDLQRGPGRDDGKAYRSSPEAAIFWSELSHSEHLSKARDEEIRRKGRANDFPHAARPRFDAEKSSARPAVPALK